MACPRVSRVWPSIHGGKVNVTCLAHIFRDDISALEYTGSLGSHRGEPHESNRACLNFGSNIILADIICVHTVNCSHNHLSCNVLGANSKRVLAHFLTYSILAYLANCPTYILCHLT